MPAEHPIDQRKNSDSVAFRVPASLKAELLRLAARNHQSLGELMRGFARERLALERRRFFKAEAQRQSREACAVAEDPASDEYTVMRELETELDELDKE